MKPLTNNFKGGFEPVLANQLDKYGVSYEYEPKKIPFILERTYCPDFVLSNGVHIEGKGVLTPDDRKKLRAIKEQHPELDIRLVFQRASNKLRRGSKTTYGDWADRYGFKWADGVIPKEWTK